jgi:hypothetical protein
MEGVVSMERGNSKHGRRLDEQLDAETRRWTHAGPGAGHADPSRDIEPVADDDGMLTGIRWLNHTDGTPPSTTTATEPDTTRNDVDLNGAYRRSSFSSIMDTSHVDNHHSGDITPRRAGITHSAGL